MSYYSEASIISSNTIKANTSDEEGGGIYLQYTNAILSANQIISNTASGDEWSQSGYGGGLSIDENTQEELIGNMIILNTARYRGGINVWDYFRMFHGTIAHNTDGDGNITHSNDYFGDPNFVNPQFGDYHIDETSAVIDQAINAGILTDFDGEARPNGYDIGADEYYEKLYIYLPLIMK